MVAWGMEIAASRNNCAKLALRLDRCRKSKHPKLLKQKNGCTPNSQAKKTGLLGVMRGGSNLARKLRVSAGVRFPGGEVLPLANFPNEKCNTMNTFHAKRLN